MNVAASSEDRNFTYVPKQSTWKLSQDAAYVHVCTNETIGGVEFHWTPDTGSGAARGRHVARTSSRGRSTCRKFGLIYAGAQKNIGPAGLVVVIVREDLLGQALPEHAQRARLQAAWPTPIRWSNTPPTFSVYLAGLTFKWLLERGGLAAIEKVNIAQGEASLRLHRQRRTSTRTRSRRRTARA